MRFICNSCQAKYSIADERVENKVVKLACQKCGNEITVRGPVTNKSEPKKAGATTLSQIQPIQRSQTAAGDDDDDEPKESTRIASLSELERMRLEALTQLKSPKPATPKPAAPPPAPAPPAGVWMLLINNQQLGPFTLDEVKAKMTAGQVNLRTYAWREGMGEWQRLAGVRELAALLPSPPPEKPKASLAVADLVDPRIQSGQSPKTASDTHKRPMAPTAESLFGPDSAGDQVPFDQSEPLFTSEPHQTSEPPPRAADSASAFIAAEQRKRLYMRIAGGAVALLGLLLLLHLAGVIAPSGDDSASGPSSAPAVSASQPKQSDNLTEEERKRIRDGLLGKTPRFKDGVDPAPFTKVVEANQGDVKSCFDKSTKRGAQIAGRLDLELTVAPKGAVTLAEVKSVKHKDTEFAECVVAATKAWKFAPFTGDPVTFEYPFMLSTGN